MQQHHIYKHDEIVIGGSLSAFLYSFFTGCPCIYRVADPPFRFDAPNQEWLPSECQNALQMWERLALSLSLGSQLPMSNKAASFSVKDNILKVATHNSRLARFEFGKLTIFDDSLISGLPPIKKRDVFKSTVIDWFNVRSGMEHAHDLIETADEFVSKIIFYPSDRFGNQKTNRIRKDLVSISFVDPSRLDDFEYSDTMARFKIEDLMRATGIKGARNGRDTQNPDLYRYYSVKIEATEREVVPHIHNHYERDKRFDFLEISPEEVINRFSTNLQTYSLKIYDLLSS